MTTAAASILGLLNKRRAVRGYTEQPIEEQDIRTLLQAAVTAPNDRLREPWHFYVIQGEAKARYEAAAEAFLTERFPTKPHLVEETMKAVKGVPLVIVVTADVIPGDEPSSRDNEYAAACAIYGMWLTAEEMGLGLVWRTRGVGLVHDGRMHEFIGSPENRKVVGTLFIGHPAEPAKPTARTPYEEKTTWL
ncbi:NAD(P)H nitroreductase [Paenibacillus chitinolyticus]|uniref:nitroreductase family protein n=1 Tax=Paenibacillus chitinolyticus TaxID=79263 RepID=UPI0026E4A450|nr:nitroreductase [Paenibacillus chitinolyticus]GKS13659.1 NAD(P)H nitroreductase [Paenibacillus chitinolyticus]